MQFISIPLDNSPFHAQWNAWTGSYEFQEEEEPMINLKKIYPAVNATLLKWVFN
jgi:hypothetical protein